MRQLLAILTASMCLVTGIASAQEARTKPIDDNLVSSLVRLDARYMDRLARIERARELRPDAEGQARVDELMARQEELYAAELGELEHSYGTDQVSLARRGIRVVRTGDDSFIIVQPNNTNDDTAEPAVDGDDALNDDSAGRGPDRGNRSKRGAAPTQRGNGRSKAAPQSGGKPEHAGQGQGRGRPEHAGNKQVVICWSPPGNPQNRRTKRVGLASVEHFLAMGATLGPCDGQPNPAPEAGAQQDDERRREVRILINGEPSIRISEDLVLQPIRDVLKRLPAQPNADELFKVAREQINGRNVDKLVAGLSDEIQLELDMLESRQAADYEDESPR